MSVTTLESDTYIFTMTSEGRSNILSYTSTTGVFVRSTTEPVVNMYRMWVLEDINYRIGDVDRSGDITVKDSTAIEKYIGGLVEFKNIDLYLADYNYDGVVNIKDVTMMEKQLAGIM